jgi:hypothetical protein
LRFLHLNACPALMPLPAAPHICPPSPPQNCPPPPKKQLIKNKATSP